MLKYVLLNFMLVLLAQMWKENLGLGNGHSLVEVFVGRGRKMVYYFEMSEMESLKIGEELERAWKSQESSSNNWKPK